jgi:hypothetical protein
MAWRLVDFYAAGRTVFAWEELSEDCKQDRRQFPRARSTSFENVAFKNLRYKDGTRKTRSL